MEGDNTVGKTLNDVDGAESEEGVDAAEEEEMQRVFRHRQKLLGATVQDLSNNIQLKEQLVQNLKKSHEHFEKMRVDFEKRLADMSEGVRLNTIDRDNLAAQIEDIQAKHSVGGADVNSSGKLSKLSRDLKDKDNHLSELRKKQFELAKAVSLSAKNDVKMRSLDAEIKAMKRQKVDLLKRMKEERQRQVNKLAPLS